MDTAKQASHYSIIFSVTECVLRMERNFFLRHCISIYFSLCIHGGKKNKIFNSFSNIDAECWHHRIFPSYWKRKLYPTHMLEKYNFFPFSHAWCL